MSEWHVTQVFGPKWVRDRQESMQRDLRLAEKIVLSLRRKLREQDPTLPHEYDGKSWAEIENVDL